MIIQAKTLFEMKSGFQQRGIIARGTVRTVWLEREVESPATSCHSAPDEDTCNLKTKEEIDNSFSPDKRPFK